MSEPDLSIFVEFGVGLAGFSGVVVAFGRGSGRLGDYDRFRVVQLLLSSLFPAFLAVTPMLLGAFGVHGTDAARIMSLAAVGAVGAAGGTASISSRRISEAARRQLSPAVWRIALGSSVLFAVWNALNAAGALGEPSYGPVIAAMTWFLVMASLMFFRLLLVRVGDTD